MSYKLGLKVLAVAMVLVAGNAWGAVQYTLTDLGTLGGTSSYAQGINNSGQVVGQSTNSSGVTEAFLYSGGTMRGLGMLHSDYGLQYSVATSINNAGVAVGYSTSEGAGVDVHFPCTFSNGSVISLGGFEAGVMGSATAINNAGQVCGYSGSDGITLAFSYSGGTMTNIGNGYGYSVGQGVNDAGLIVGVLNAINNPSARAFLWQNGSMSDLGDLQHGAGAAQALAINNSNQIVGDSLVSGSTYANGVFHATLWENGSMTDFGTFGGLQSSALAINNNGVIIGWADTTSGQATPFICTGRGPMQDLTSIAPFSGWTSPYAIDINDNGQICGFGTNPSGQVHGFLLTPVPEPSTIALLGMGVVGLLGWAWKRRKA